MTQIAAMKQALEALGKIEEHGNVPGWCEFDTNEDAVNYHEAFNKGMKASTALRAAIEQAEKAEPVAVVDDAGTIIVCSYGYKPGDKLFTHPAPVPAGCEDEGCPHYGTPHSHGKLPAGWQLVPVEHTDEMLDACYEALQNTPGNSYSIIYKAMLQAAPKPGEMK